MQPDDVDLIVEDYERAEVLLKVQHHLTRAGSLSIDDFKAIVEDVRIFQYEPGPWESK